MTDQPLYRGTRSELAAKHAQAREWFEEKLLEAVKAAGATEEELREVGRGCPNPGQDSPRANRLYNMAVDRTSSGGYYTSARRAEYDDYFYVWNIDYSFGSSYGKTRIVIRRNGSLHMENLGNAALGWARRRLRQRQEADTFKANHTLWTAAGLPGETEPGVTVELSNTTPGRATVSFYRRGLQHKQPVQIGKITDLIAFLDKTADALVEMRDS